MVKMVCEKWRIERGLDGRYSVRITDIMSSNSVRGTTRVVVLVMCRVGEGLAGSPFMVSAFRVGADQTVRRLNLNLIRIDTAADA